jgi:1,4-dihydroxy-2-naphthoate octaprenyltransferase
MATVAEWIEGARVRTLPNAVAPVLVGSGAAADAHAFTWWGGALALVVSLSLVVGVNYANDYSDGIRGTDDHRVGPQRLVGSGAAEPADVLHAALACFGVTLFAGLLIVIFSGQWWLLGVGAVCVAAAWYYTGGSRPYGYAGLGELAVFLFFGPVAVLGTQYVQLGDITGQGIGASVAVGSFSTAVLVANNLRDIYTDDQSGKRTLAVLLGDKDTRYLYCALISLPYVLTALAAIRDPWLLIALLSAPLLLPAVRPIVDNKIGPSLVPVLKHTGLALLAWSALATYALFRT